MAYAEERDSISTHLNILKGKRASFANSIFLLKVFGEPGGKGHSFAFCLQVPGTCCKLWRRRVPAAARTSAGPATKSAHK